MNKSEKMHFIVQIWKQHDTRGFGGCLIGDILHIANVIVSDKSEGDYTELIENVEKDICSYWAGGDMRRDLSLQTDDCINYIYNFLFNHKE